MSRAFVINGDEWGFCKKREMRCPGANDEGECMRPECTEAPAWEQPKRDIREERRRKLMEQQKQNEKPQPAAEKPAAAIPKYTKPASAGAFTKTTEKSTAAGNAAKSMGSPAVRPAGKSTAKAAAKYTKPVSAGNEIKSIWKPVPVKRPQKWK